MMATKFNPPRANEVTTSFTTVHKDKIAKFPFKLPFEPAKNLVNIDENKALDPKTPKVKLPKACQFPLDFVPEAAFEEFITLIPSKDAPLSDVQDWFEKWFKACPTLANDPYLPKFLERIAMTGFWLHNFKEYNIFERLLGMYNVEMDGSQRYTTYSKEIIVELAQYAWYARMKADEKA